MNTALQILQFCIVPIIVALIAVWRKENKQQHDRGAGLLEHLSGQVGGIDRKVDRLDERLDNVQTWQAEHEKEHLMERDTTDI